MTRFLPSVAAGLKRWVPVSCGALLMIATSPPAVAEPKPVVPGEKTFSVRLPGREDDRGVKIPVTRQEVSQAMDVVESRLDALGFKNATFSNPGDEGFTFRLKGARPDQGPGIARALGKLGHLELRGVSPRNDEQNANGKSLAERVSDGSELVPGFRVYLQTSTNENGKESSKPILLNRRVAIGSSDVETAVPSSEQADAVSITLSRQGADKMIALTKDLRPGIDRIAIVLDGKVVSAPVVNQVPLGKNFVLEGFHKPGEPQELADSLSNPLPRALVIEELTDAPAEKDSK